MDDTTKLAASAAARIEPDPKPGNQKSGDAFVSRVSAEPKLWLKGDPDALAAMGG